MKIKVSEATNLQLDWLVAKCRGYSEIKIYLPHRPTDRGWIEVRFNPDPKTATARFDPTENWFFGGPIIERECIELHAYDAASLVPKNPAYWEATIFEKDEGIEYYGPTPLVAAMRAYVASKLGDEVEVPDEFA